MAAMKKPAMWHNHIAGWIPEINQATTTSAY